MQYTTPSETLRPLGDMEYTYWMMGIASSTNFVVTCHLCGEIDEQIFAGALRTVQQTTPLLNVCIEPDRHHGAVFRTCPGEYIPLYIDHVPDIAEPHSGISSDTPLLRRIEEEQRFDFFTVTKPLLRCLLLRHDPCDMTLVCTFHHAIADALSAVTVVQRIVTAVAASSAATAPDNQATLENGPLEKHIPKKFTGIQAAGVFASHACRQSLLRLLPGQVHIPVQHRAWPDERRDRFITSVLDAATTEALRRTVRHNNCSLHAALCSAQLLALKKEYPSRTAIRTWLLSLVDLRRRIAPPCPSDQLGLMISMVESLFTITDATSFWELARRIGSRSTPLLDNGFHFSYLPAMCHLLRTTQWMRTPDRRGSRQMLRQGNLVRPQVLSVSNIGAVYMPAMNGAIQCEALSFFLPLSSSGLFGSAVNSFRGNLYWNFSYADPAVSEETATHLAENSISILTGAIM